MKWYTPKEKSTNEMNVEKTFMLRGELTIHKRAHT